VSARGAFDAATVCVLADKVLHAWLRNRYQLLFPFRFDLRQLSAPQATLVFDAMVVAAQADGALDGRERERILAALGAMGGADAMRDPAPVDAALANPKPLPEVLRQVRDVETAALVYAASLIAIDQRRRVNRHYLRYLAARLQLPDDLAGSLEQRFRSSA
jgi:uncharacterized membrane protein YebE (DUF533 family)